MYLKLRLSFRLLLCPNAGDARMCVRHIQSLKRFNVSTYVLRSVIFCMSMFDAHVTDLNVTLHFNI